MNMFSKRDKFHHKMDWNFLESNLWLDIFCSRYGFFSFVLSLISTVCELFFTKEVPCFTLQDIFISGEVLVLAFFV